MNIQELKLKSSEVITQAEELVLKMGTLRNKKFFAILKKVAEKKKLQAGVAIIARFLVF